MNIGEKIYDLRHKKKMTQFELAEKIEVSKMASFNMNEITVFQIL